MAKPHREIRLIESAPVGPISDAPRPIPVRVRVAFTLNPQRTVVIEAAWAMAWTTNEVLVFWRTDDQPTTAWVPADDVQRRSS